MYLKIRGSSGFSTAKRIPTIILMFTLPAILLAQRWDKMAAFPVPTSYYSSSLNDVTTGPDGALWYTDSNRSVVGRMTTTGAITEYSVYSSPQPITSGPDGALWIGLYSAIGRITTDGVITSTQLPSCCTQVQGITPGPDGALWFTEGGCCSSTGNRIGRITTAGVITEFPEIPNSNPLSIVAGRDGALWFTEQGGNRIGRITTSGFIVELPVPSCCGPEYITVGQDGALWFTEPSANNIARINAEGLIVEYPLPNGNSNPWGITGGPDGAIWFTEQGAARIGRITASVQSSTGAVIVEYSIPANYSAPGAITAGPDGNLWFTESSGSQSSGLGEALGQAAACAPALNVTYANSDLNLAFTLGTSQPSAFGTYLIDGANIEKLWLRSIPAVDPPHSFTQTITGVPPLGFAAVLSLISTAANGLTCYDLELVNTSAAPAMPTALEQARRTIVESGILEKLQKP